MKYFKLLLAGAFLISPFNQIAQEQPTEQADSRQAKKKVVFGIKAGFNRSNVFGASGEGFAANRKSGYAAGAFLALPLGSLLGIQGELMLLQKGFTGSGRLLGESYQITRTTTHLDFPVQAMIKPFRWFTFLLGPNYSFMLKQNDRLTSGGNIAEQEKVFAQDDISKNTFGFISGFDLNIRHIVLSGRWGWDLHNNASTTAAGTPRYKNSWVQGTIGYRFY
jgi:hypothetical protein